MHAHLALFVDLPDPARAHAEAAIALLTGAGGDRTLLAAALLHLFFNEVRAGEPPRVELLDRALEMEGPEPSWLAGTIPAIWWKSIDDPARARRRLGRMLDLAAARCDEPSQYDLLKHLGETELLAGRWSTAERHIAAARELGELLGTEATAEIWLAGLLDALRGERLDDDWCRRIHLQLGAFVALCAGRMADAAAGYGRLAATVDRMGLAEPLAQRFEPDWIEACVGAGDLVTARVALARLAERHRRLPRPWTRLGLAAAPTRRPPWTNSLPRGPPCRRRCCRWTGRGVCWSRAWCTAGPAASAAPSDLTATEERVARLAAQGRTSRAIADELFVSPKTVETNLSRVYRKLGISRRAELGAALARVGGADEQARGPAATASAPAGAVKG
ncbi:helix-turn-helix transcriptional regulator [Verrucosispora sioxanthis]|uniref:helix-turn-helix transcriptional regulator n=1 Tax=Verrucosispora sioxanthis TaxID=2499994 RepID=UPI002816414F|nr:helix-turn-helix transcriptional regulator [Verrucosispora sioxanthis]